MMSVQGPTAAVGQTKEVQEMISNEALKHINIC